MKINKIQIFEEKKGDIYKKTINFSQNFNVIFSEGNSFGKSIIIQSLFFAFGAGENVFKIEKNSKINKVVVDFTENDQLYTIYKFNDYSALYKNNEYLGKCSAGEISKKVFNKEILTRGKGNVKYQTSISHLMASLTLLQGRKDMDETSFSTLLDKNAISTDRKTQMKWLVDYSNSIKRYELEYIITKLKSEKSLKGKEVLYNKDEIKLLSEKFKDKINDKKALEFNIRDRNKKINYQRKFYTWFF